MYRVIRSDGKTNEGISVQRACGEFYNLWYELNRSYSTKVKIEQLENHIIWKFKYTTFNGWEYTISRF